MDEIVRHAVRQRVERRHRHCDTNEGHGVSRRRPRARSRLPAGAHGLSSCPPRRPACARGSAAGMPGGRSGSSLRTAVLVDASAQARDGVLRLQQRLRGEGAEGHDDLRLDAVDLTEEEAFTRLDFVGIRIPVAGRPAFDDVRDVDVVARQADGFDDLRQQLACAARRTGCPAGLRRRRAPLRRTSGPRGGFPRRRRSACGPSACSLHRVQSPMSSRMASSVSSRRPRRTTTGTVFERCVSGDSGAAAAASRRRHAGSRLMPVTPRSWKKRRCSATQVVSRE